MLSKLPKEILTNIFSRLEIDQELKLIKLYNLPNRITKRIHNDKIENVSNLLKRKFEIDNVLKYVFLTPYYVDLTHTFHSKYKHILVSYVNSYMNLRGSE
jgi:hypothetical protein